MLTKEINLLNYKYNLKNFVIGKSNQLAYIASQKVIINPGKIYNPLFLYGSDGLGKTHLLHAIGNEIIITYKNRVKVLYIHSERFVQDMVTAIRNNTIEKFKHYYRSINLLLIDDVQFFANKKRSQEEFFHTFNILFERNQQIVLASKFHPKEIVGLNDYLKSRFIWGLTVEIKPPEFGTCIEILQKKANDNNVFLSNEVAFFIAKHSYSNIRELEGLLNCVILNANLNHQKLITTDFVQKILFNILFIKRKSFSIYEIQKSVSKYFKIQFSDLLSMDRSHKISYARQIAILLCKKLTECSLSEIGKFFGKRRHTTILYAIQKIRKVYKSSCFVKNDISRIIKMLNT